MERRHADEDFQSAGLLLDHISDPEPFQWEADEAPEILVTDLASLPPLEDCFLDEEEHKSSR